MLQKVKVTDAATGNIIPSWHICKLVTINKLLSVFGFNLMVKLDDDGPTCFLISRVR